MEVITKRALIFGGILLCFGAAARLQPRAVATWRTEDWMEQVLPTSLPGYSVELGPDGAKRTYRAPQSVYDKLKPYGMVGRIFTKDDRAVDTLVVAGNDRDCFHDPYVCFPAQDVEILKSHGATVETKSHGAVPVTVFKVKYATGEQSVLFCYRGPDGFHPTQNALYSGWFWNELRLGKPAEGAFYRFMGVKGETSEEELKAIAAEYLDAANATSGGVL